MSQPSGLLYELVFDAALSMSRACNQTGDQLGIAMAQTLFKICNGWSRDSQHFPLAVLEAAAEVAVEWQKVTMDDEISNEQGQSSVPPVGG